jgi:hypothetical protein
MILLFIFALAFVFGATVAAIKNKGGMHAWVYDVAQRRIVSKRNADVVIYELPKGNGDVEELPYLRRWFVIPRNRFFNIYLHQFMRSDKDVPHDHPWASLSLLLKGWAVDVRLLTDDSEPYQTDTTVTRVVGEGDWVFRGAKYAHKVVVGESAATSGGVWTLFITGPKIRQWGFYCADGWKAWKDFMADGKC